MKLDDERNRARALRGYDERPGLQSMFGNQFLVALMIVRMPFRLFNQIHGCWAPESARGTSD
jgi:hypothetical protein